LELLVNISPFSNRKVFPENLNIFWLISFLIPVGLGTMAEPLSPNLLAFYQSDEDFKKYRANA